MVATDRSAKRTHTERIRIRQRVKAAPIAPRKTGPRKATRPTKEVVRRVVSKTSRAGVLPHAGDQRICKKCGQGNAGDADICAACGSKRLAPSWVLDRREITKQFEVQITESSKEFGEPEARITLNKWWPNSAGRSPTLHITTPEHWVKIRDIVETEFGPRLGWAILDPKAPTLPSAGVSPAQLRKLVRQNPGVASQALAEELGPTATFSPEAVEMVQRISKAQEKLERPYVEAYQQLIEKLPTQGGKALVELSQLLEGWSLHQVTQVTGEAKRRLQTIALFERLMLDDDTYEIRGNGSIHRVLEGAMWIVDERYWLMSSNAALRTLLGRKIVEEQPKAAKLRPDFACAQTPSRGVIIEIKRPSHALTIADLNQAERYVVLAEEFGPGSEWSAILVGQIAEDEVRKTIKHRRDVTVRTYNELLEDTKHRYREFLKAFDPSVEQLATGTVGKAVRVDQTRKQAH